MGAGPASRQSLLLEDCSAGVDMARLSHVTSTAVVIRSALSRRGKTVASLATLLLACALPAASAERQPEHWAIKLPVTDGRDIRFKQTPFGDGQSHDRVIQIVQDDLGFLWFGTQDGIKRYDGYRFRNFRHESTNPGSLGGNYIYAMFKDRDGKLWIGCDQSFDRYDPATEIFTHYHPPTALFEGPVSHFSQDRQGMIWIATNHGLNRLDPVTWRVMRYRHVAGDPTSLSSDLVRSTFEERDGTFWVATAKGLDIFARETGKVISHLPLPQPASVSVTVAGPLVSLFEDHAGVLWTIYSFENGLARVDRRAGKLIRYTFDGAGKRNSTFSGIGAIREDEAGNLWLGSNTNGILKLDASRKQFVRYKNAFGDGDDAGPVQVQSLLEDRESNFWMGTKGFGAYRFSPRPAPFHGYRHERGNPNSLASNLVSAAYEDSKGFLWVANKGTLNRIERATGRFTFFRGTGQPGDLSNGYVISIIEDSAGYLWFGTFGGGLNRFDRHANRFKAYRHDPADATSLSNDTVSGLFIDREGRLWAATDDGVSLLNRETEHFQRFRHGHYHALLEDSVGAVWLATWDTGIERLDPATWRVTTFRHSRSPGSLSDDNVNALFIDHSGIIWVGTQTGLDRFDPAKGVFTVYYERDGLPNNNVTGILEDKRGGLWLATNNGLSRFNPGEKTFKNYYESDGILANEFSGFNVAWKSRSGEMFFGSFGGLTTFFPEQVADNRYIPPVVLTDFELLGKPARIGAGSPLKQSISVTNSLTLNHSQTVFSFEFSALSFTSPERNRYQYRLRNLEAAWNEADSNHRSVMYTTLPPGQYVFEVKGSNNQGVWNEKGVSLPILIRPPLWATGWFRAGCAAMILVLLWGLHQFRLRRQAREFNTGLEARVSERTRIARELHDTLLQSFQGLMLRLQAVADRLPPSETRELLDKALEQGDQAIIEGREAVHDLRSSMEITNDLAEAMKALGLEMGQELAGKLAPEDSAAPNSAPHPTKFRVMVKGASGNLHPILRDEVYRIAREAVRNAFHHAQAREIEAEITYSDKLLRVRIRDDGRGMDPAIAGEGRSGHYGLPGMRERAKRIGGQLNVWSASGAGTEIELNIPGSIAYGASAGHSRFRLFRKRMG